MSKEKTSCVLWTKRLLPELKEVGCFYLGESFSAIQSFLIWAIGYAKTKVPYVFLTTNGSLAKPEYIERCMEAGLDSLKFSINASDDEQFRVHHGCEGQELSKPSTT